MNTGNTLAGWVPLFVRGARREIEWGYMGGERFTDPFCHETLQRLATRPFNKLFRRTSGLDLLLQQATEYPGLPLRGIVFHLGRCGSTLAAQWLAALPDSVVLSEPEPLDVVLKWLPPDGNEAVLHGLLSAMGQPRRESDRSLFVKTDGLHMLHIDRLLSAFPGVPWVFLYRDPVEVLVSYRRLPSWMLMMEAMLTCGIQPPAEIGSDPEAYTAWVLSVFLRMAGQAVSHYPNGLLLNYAQMPQMLKHMGTHFGVDPALGDTRTMQAVRARDPKMGGAFRPDSAEKRAAADRHIRDLAARWLDEPYRVLEGLRAQAAGE